MDVHYLLYSNARMYSIALTAVTLIACPALVRSISHLLIEVTLLRVIG